MVKSSTYYICREERVERERERTKSIVRVRAREVRLSENQHFLGDAVCHDTPGPSITGTALHSPTSPPAVAGKAVLPAAAARGVAPGVVRPEAWRVAGQGPRTGLLPTSRR